MDLMVLRERDQIAPFHLALYQRVWEDLVKYSTTTELSFIDLPRSVPMLEYTKMGMWFQFLHENKDLVLVAPPVLEPRSPMAERVLSDLFRPPRSPVYSPISPGSAETPSGWSAGQGSQSALGLPTSTSRQSTALGLERAERASPRVGQPLEGSGTAGGAGLTQLKRVQNPISQWQRSQNVNPLIVFGVWVTVIV